MVNYQTELLMEHLRLQALSELLYTQYQERVLYIDLMYMLQLNVMEQMLMMMPKKRKREILIV